MKISYGTLTACFAIAALLNLSSCVSTAEIEAQKASSEAEKANLAKRKFNAILANPELSHQLVLDQYNSTSSAYENSSLLTDPLIQAQESSDNTFWTFLPTEDNARLYMLGVNSGTYKIDRSRIDRQISYSGIYFLNEREDYITRSGVAQTGHDYFDVASVEKLLESKFDPISYFIWPKFNSGTTPTLFVMDLDENGYPVNIQPFLSESRRPLPVDKITPPSVAHWNNQLAGMLKKIQFKHVRHNEAVNVDRKNLVVKLYLASASKLELIHSGSHFTNKYAVLVNDEYGTHDGRNGYPTGLLPAVKGQMQKRQETVAYYKKKWDEDKAQALRVKLYNDELQQQKRADEALAAERMAEQVRHVTAQRAARKQQEETARAARAARVAYEKTPEGQAEVAAEQERERIAREERKAYKLANWPAEAVGKIRGGAWLCPDLRSARISITMERAGHSSGNKRDCSTVPWNGLFLSKIQSQQSGITQVFVSDYGRSYYTNNSKIERK